MKFDIKKQEDKSLAVNFYFEDKLFFRETGYSEQDTTQGDKFIQAVSLFAVTLSKVCQGNVQTSLVIFEGSSDTSGRGVM